MTAHHMQRGMEEYPSWQLVPGSHTEFSTMNMRLPKSVTEMLMKMSSTTSSALLSVRLWSSNFRPLLYLPSLKTRRMRMKRRTRRPTCHDIRFFMFVRRQEARAVVRCGYGLGGRAGGRVLNSCCSSCWCSPRRGCNCGATSPQVSGSKEMLATHQSSRIKP